MIHILVVEDQQESRDAIGAILQEYTQMEVTFAATKEEAENCLKGKIVYDLFLLDINLNEKEPENQDGYRLAEQIRNMEKYDFTPIVMVTSVSGLEMSAYRKLHCYAFLVKPFFKEEVQELVEKILAQKNEKQIPTIVVKKDGINYRIKCPDIVYIKAVPRGVCICLKNEELLVRYLSIRQILEKLPQEDFFQIHRMFVINIQYLEQVDIVNRLVKLRGKKEQLDIGVTYKEKVRGLLDA
ncbi:MAG: LytR/AlgR family response regulator transcription factor [Lachnospiraceae bacterium]